jgi:hypothetical protein
VTGDQEVRRIYRRSGDQEACEGLIQVGHRRFEINEQEIKRSGESTGGQEIRRAVKG